MDGCFSCPFLSISPTVMVASVISASEHACISLTYEIVNNLYEETVTKINGQFQQISILSTKYKGCATLGPAYRIIFQSNPPMSVHPII